MFLKVKGGGGGGEFNHPVQGRGSKCSQRVRSINRIAPQGSHRYSRMGHNIIVLQDWTVGEGQKCIGSVQKKVAGLAVGSIDETV